MLYIMAGAASIAASWCMVHTLAGVAIAWFIMTQQVGLSC